MSKEDQGASPDGDRVTDASHEASELSSPFGSVPTSAGLCAKLRASAAGLCSENPHDYMARRITAGDCLDAAEIITDLSEALAGLLARVDDRWPNGVGESLWKEPVAAARAAIARVKGAA